MAKNDAILLNGIVDEVMSMELLDRGEAFELFALQQVLKSYDLTRDEIELGWVDGRDDGGIDGFFTFVNGVLLRSPSADSWPRRNVSLDIWIISCKSHASFKQAPLNTLFPTIEELLDFGKEPRDFKGAYSAELLQAREVAVHAFRSTASALPSVNFSFAYVSRGNLAEVEANVEARGNQLKRIVSDYFSAATVTLEYLGATELIALHRKNRVILELPFIEQLARERSAYVFLVPIDRYASFVSDEHGQLRRYLFDSNVRDFLGQNRVNSDIAGSLLDRNAPDFWWLNNGVTILATSAVPLGKIASGLQVIQLHDVQVVNGLQTTQSIYNYFKTDGAEANDRCVLVKVVISEDEGIRDSIIQATNNQSQVELAALNATDKIQRDIEQILESNGWYYERRRNYYKNIGKPSERFITPLQIAVAFVAILKIAPQKASSLKTRFMRNPVSYSAVFSERIPIEVWPKLAGIIKAVERGLLATISQQAEGGDRVLGQWRGPVALCAVSKLSGAFGFDIRTLINLDIDRIDHELVEGVFESLRDIRRSHYLYDKEGKKLLRDFDFVCGEYGRRMGISNTELIGQWQLPSAPDFYTTPGRKLENRSRVSPEIGSETIARVKALLPPQPWPSGTHKVVGDALQLDKRIVREAILSLIRSGEFHNQHKGVVVDARGRIVAVDPIRADSRYRVGDTYEPI